MAAGDVITSIPNPISYPCFSFDGVDDNLSITKNLISGKFSISLWFYLKKALTNDQYLIDIGTTGSNNEMYIIQASAQAIIGGFRRDNGGTTRTVSFNAAGNYTLNEWHNLILTVDSTGEGTRLYFDNVLKGTSASTFTVGTIPEKFFIGAASSLSGGFTGGLIRDVRIYNGKILSASDRSNIYANSPVEDGLTSQYKLSQDSNDSAGNNNLTVTGAMNINSATNVAALFKASRSGATDKYFATEVNGNILMATIQET